MSAVLRAACIALIAFGASLSLAPRSAAQPTVRIAEPATGASAAVLRAALAAPHVTIVARDSMVRLRGDTSYTRSVLILGSGATVDGRVQGDVIVVGGDLWLRPNATVTGRAIAIGGGVYPSALATVTQGTQSFRDETYDLESSGGAITLRFRALRTAGESGGKPILQQALGFIHVPGYDRVDGLSLPLGPTFDDEASRIFVGARVTYRSHLGAWDPALTASWRPKDSVSVRIFAGRSTWTNDAWIRSDLLNGVTYLFRGTDTRNYYRADRGELTVANTWNLSAGTFELSAGAQTERAWSVGSPGPTQSQSAPWTLMERDSLGAFRPNPPVTRGRISSALVGGRFEWQAEDIRARLGARVEAPWDAPGGARFVQATIDADIAFPTFRTQRFAVKAHALATVGDTAPPQRYGYLGGPGTIPTVDLFRMGGDRLLFIDSGYEVPIEGVNVPMLGAPTVGLVYIVGSAGVGRLPSFVQNVGPRLDFGVVRAELLIDPKSHRHKLSLSLVTSRLLLGS